DAPEGTCIHFSKDGNRLELEVMNISIGGSLAAWAQTRTDMPENSPLAVAQRLEDVALLFPAEVMREPIHIRSLEIKRIEQKPPANRYELGLEFCEISDNEKKRLTDLIYELQRQYLRHRLPVDL
ncbi:MAG: PilZ domain-containing protein, partial [Desulfobacterales bacterium]